MTEPEKHDATPGRWDAPAPSGSSSSPYAMPGMGGADPSAPDFGGFDFGGLDMGGLMAQAQAMQQQLATAQAELAEMEFTGTAGGDLVSATVSGNGELESVTIKPEACDPEDTESLGDLVVAAVRDAQNQMAAAAAAKLGPVSGGLGF